MKSTIRQAPHEVNVRNDDGNQINQHNTKNQLDAASIMCKGTKRKLKAYALYQCLKYSPQPIEGRLGLGFIQRRKNIFEFHTIVRRNRTRSYDTY